jgi:hypothetical protein
MTKIVVLCADVLRALGRESKAGSTSISPFPVRLWAAIKELFSNPVIRIGDGRISGEQTALMTVATSAIRGTVADMKHPYKIYLSSVTCMNLMKLDSVLKAIAPLPNTKETFLIILAGHVVDHTAMEYLHHFQDQCLEAGHNCAIVGAQHFRSFSDHVLAYRVNQSQNILAFA